MYDGHGPGLIPSSLLSMTRWRERGFEPFLCVPMRRAIAVPLSRLESRIQDNKLASARDRYVGMTQLVLSHKFVNFRVGAGNAHALYVRLFPGDQIKGA